MRWELLYSRVADGEWRRIGHNLAAESVELPALRCALGCVFKARGPRGRGPRAGLEGGVRGRGWG